ncbi:hypothetical protein D9613_010853 [Agrocybe pediades]|uniref:F-box domain-containing protein n=1 Tax=Agrocybe pediades TaxID=84607 RepID=A0A8H4VKJ2_9AGAR|nr:hypothetical protein D9613_010853 [Agrocybe pediades]
MPPSTDDANDSPISILHEDLLFNIFLENTFLEFDDKLQEPISFYGRTSALTTARHCSQVSRQWRSIYLSSSFIWGRLIDVGELAQKTDDWRNEVIARTGEALLWVYGRSRSAKTPDFFHPFLLKNWERVQILIIEQRIYNWSSSRTYRQKMWAFLREPAPQLQRIYISGISSSLAETYLPPAHSLFNNNAPRLKHFSISNKIPHTSWRGNLSSLSLSSQFAMEEFLKLLQDMPELTSLKIIDQSLISNPNQEVFPPVILPKLKRLSLAAGGSFLNAGTILQCITPSPDCCLCAPLQNMRELNIRTAGDYKRYEAGLASFILPYLSLHPPSGEVKLVALCNCSFVLLQLSGQDFAITFSAHSESRHSHSPRSPLLKKLISQAAFAKVNMVTVQNLSFTPPQLEAFNCILEAFPSATTLEAADSFLQTLFHHLDRNRMSALLPALVTLKVSNRFPPEEYVERESPLERFLELRKEIGRQISVLDLGVITGNKWAINLDHFELDHPGLLVKWSSESQRKCSIDGVRRNIEEYRCGDGHPERLRFAAKQVTTSVQ